MFLFPDTPHHALAAVTFHPSQPWLLLVSHSQHWLWFDFERGVFTEQSKQQLNNFPAQVCYFIEVLCYFIEGRVVSHSQHWTWFDFERGVFTEQSKQQLNNCSAQVC